MHAELHLAADQPQGALPHALACTLHAHQLGLGVLAAEAGLLLAATWAALCPAHTSLLLQLAQVGGWAGGDGDGSGPG